MLNVTKYEIVTSFLIALIIGLLIAVIWLLVIWISTRPPKKDDAVPVEFIQMAGGYEDGAVDETLDLESPEDPTQDATLAEIESDETEVEEALEAVEELSDDAAQQVQEQLALDAQNAGTPGSSDGTGRRPLGSGGGPGGFPNDQRWFIRFSDEGSLQTYAEQLDHFGIELGALVGGKMYYVSNFSAAKPTKRESTSGAGENRLYMTWRGGGRKKSDIDLFRKVGVDVGSGTLFHFYPKKSEALLLQTELSYRDRKVEEIRRTYFTVKGTTGNYTFSVTRQSYFN